MSDSIVNVPNSFSLIERLLLSMTMVVYAINSELLVSADCNRGRDRDLKFGVGVGHDRAS